MEHFCRSWHMMPGEHFFRLLLKWGWYEYLFIMATESGIWTTSSAWHGSSHRTAERAMKLNHPCYKNNWMIVICHLQSASLHTRFPGLNSFSWIILSLLASPHKLHYPTWLELALKSVKATTNPTTPIPQDATQILIVIATSDTLIIPGSNTCAMDKSLLKVSRHT